MGKVLLTLFQRSVLGKRVQSADLIGYLFKMRDNFDVNFFQEVIAYKG